MLQANPCSCHDLLQCPKSNGNSRTCCTSKTSCSFFPESFHVSIISLVTTVDTADSKVDLPKSLANTKVVCISNLQWWTKDSTLEAICSDFGKMEEISFMEDKVSGKSKGQALVSFADIESANLCRQHMHG